MSGFFGYTIYMSLVTPAVLPASRQELDEKLALFASLPGVSRIQIDVVDGRFASPASWPYTVPQELEKMKAGGEMLPKLYRMEYEVDLMCRDAVSAAGDWLTLGATRLTLHAETVLDAHHLLTQVRERYGAGSDFTSNLISFGMALNVDSDLALIEGIVSEVDYVQFMGIAKIGSQGQPFDERVLEKVRLFHAKHPEVPLQADGGITLANAKKLHALGVTNLVVGSGLLRANNVAAALAAFEALQTSYGV